jgi:hypothetical protein
MWFCFEHSVKVRTYWRAEAWSGSVELPFTLDKSVTFNRVMLQQHGIVAAATEAKRDRVFCAKALLDILEEPARLTPLEPTRPASGPSVPQT